MTIKKPQIRRDDSYNLTSEKPNCCTCYWPARPVGYMHNKHAETTTPSTSIMLYQSSCSFCRLVGSFSLSSVCSVCAITLVLYRYGVCKATSALWASWRAKWRIKNCIQSMSVWPSRPARSLRYVLHCFHWNVHRTCCLLTDCSHRMVVVYCVIIDQYYRPCFFVSDIDDKKSARLIVRYCFQLRHSEMA